jgi:minimal PKS ketosynthase (KS/KS alpha)
MTGLKADGVELASAIIEAMRQGGHRAEDIDHIGAHGTGTRQNDRHETAAYKLALGEACGKNVPISAIKSTIGHALGASGALQLAACALAIEHGAVPPTMHLTTPDPECTFGVHAAHEASETPRRYQIDVALAAASGFGGLQSAVILARTEAAE